MAKSNKNKEKGAKPKKKGADEVRKVVSINRKATHRYEVLQTLECGLVLVGSEVKSLREGKVSLEEAFGRVRGGEAWLMGCEIPEYRQASVWNHEPKRPRKLLMHSSEVRKFANRAHEQGLTLTPLEMYFNERGVAKVVMALCRGRKLHDKREVIKKADVKRDLDRAMKQRTQPPRSN
ncbi:SsrA-binding protein SmpB [Lignipirellula cremea]|uniref:SsrA-binding protein n=1 Tax=Lignipirellula cremea TaxID=2528010 RepID=A0A518DUF9_9BACT|nr:SsrA-binding protein SmpB [Lignipirellula cremea]QDU95472.1 SsrA-binding protein [Lignipirellula cremea]